MLNIISNNIKKFYGFKTKRKYGFKKRKFKTYVKKPHPLSQFLFLPEILELSKIYLNNYKEGINAKTK